MFIKISFVLAVFFLLVAILALMLLPDYLAYRSMVTYFPEMSFWTYILIGDNLRIIPSN